MKPFWDWNPTGEAERERKMKVLQDLSLFYNEYLKWLKADKQTWNIWTGIGNTVMACISSQQSDSDTMNSKVVQ